MTQFLLHIVVPKSLELRVQRSLPHLQNLGDRLVIVDGKAIIADINHAQIRVYHISRIGDTKGSPLTHNLEQRLCLDG
jgi:hypothetical protein